MIKTKAINPAATKTGTTQNSPRRTSKNGAQDAGKMASYKIESKALNWELTQETKEIGGYTCYKATLKNVGNKKKVLNAWYAPAISVSYGPLQFVGLPGLILQLEKNTVVFTAKKIVLNPIEGVEIEEPKKVKRITQEEYKKLMKKSFPEFYQND